MLFRSPLLILPSIPPSIIGKDSDAGRDWGQEEKGTTEDEMAEWHHWFDDMYLGDVTMPLTRLRQDE